MYGCVNTSNQNGDWNQRWHSGVDLCLNKWQTVRGMENDVMRGT